MSPAIHDRFAALPRRLGATLAAVALAAAGCASAQSPPPGSTQAPPGEETPARDPAPEPSAPESPASHGDEEPGLRDLCRQAEDEDAVVDRSRQVLEETFCGATLWVDGLFGGQGDVAAARSTSGRVELSTLYRDFDGFDGDIRLDLRYDLPTLERRVNLFLGRSEGAGAVENREEPSTLRSAVSELDAAREWLGGVGVRAPEWVGDAEFRLGVRGATSPEVFTQGRWRQDLTPGPRSTWRFQETLFWTHREGFGLTLGSDFYRSISAPLLFRWSGVATLSEASEGVVWRTGGLLYRSLGSRRAIATELFALGATSAEVALQDYGARAIYRHPLGRPYLFGEFVAGYSWPREEVADPRRGYPMFGVGVELLFGDRGWGMARPVPSPGDGPGR